MLESAPDGPAADPVSVPASVRGADRSIGAVRQAGSPPSGRRRSPCRGRARRAPATTGPRSASGPAATPARRGPRAPARRRRCRAPGRRPSGGARRSVPPVASISTYGVRSKYEDDDLQSSGPGSSGKGHRIGWFTERHEPPAGPQHPRHLGHDALGVGDERQPPVGRARRRRSCPVGERERAGVGLQQRHGDPGGRFSSAARASIPPERSSATTSAPGAPQPARAGRRAAADLEHAPAARRPRAGAPRPPAAPPGTRGTRRRRGRRRARPVVRRVGVPPAPVGARDSSAPAGRGRRRRPRDSRRCPAEVRDRTAGGAHDTPIVTAGAAGGAADPGGPGRLASVRWGMRQKSVVLFPSRDRHGPALPAVHPRGRPTAGRPVPTHPPSGATHHMTSTQVRPQHPPGRRQRHRLGGGLPRRHRPDDQVLQRWRHRRGHHRQGRPGRGPARHRLQDRGRHPLARALHQARRRPATRSSRSATRSRPSSSRRRTRKAG